MTRSEWVDRCLERNSQSSSGFNWKSGVIMKLIGLRFELPTFGIVLVTNIQRMGRESEKHTQKLGILTAFVIGRMREQNVRTNVKRVFQ
jgi:hypothetical protein